MKWYVGFSVGTCCTVFIGFLGALALTSFHVWNDDQTVPLDQSDEWMTHVIALIPVSVIVMFLCFFFLWTIVSTDWKRFFISTLVLNFFILVTTVYFAVTFATELDAVQASGEVLYAKTKATIIQELGKSGKNTWLPSWLDEIQKHSKECCGIQTFRDWEEFWPSAETEIPSSCCKDPSNATTFCPTDLSRIPFPGTPSMYIKTDIGCLDEINDKAKQNIHQCFVYATILCCLLALSEIAYLCQFYKQYIPPSPNANPYFSPPAQGSKEEIGGGDKQVGKGNVPAADSANAGSYIELSGFSSTMGSAGTIQSGGSGIDPDTGSPTQSLAFSVTMSSYDPTLLNSSPTSALPGVQQSLGRINEAPDQLRQKQPATFGGGGGNRNILSEYDSIPIQQGGLSVVSSTSSVDATGSGTELDSNGKKKKKKHHHHHHRHNQDTSAGNEGPEAVVNRQEVIITPDTSSNVEEFPVNSVDELVTFSTSPSSSVDDVGDQLADGMRPAYTSPQTANKDRKGLMSMTRRRRH